jgi:hypothetical protein
MYLSNKRIDAGMKCKAEFVLPFVVLVYSQNIIRTGGPESLAPEAILTAHPDEVSLVDLEVAHYQAPRPAFLLVINQN